MAHTSNNILIVDDTPANLTILRQMLTEHGYRVRPALSGEIALKAVEADIPDLILLDIMMPGMNGFEVCETLKSDAGTRDIPVLFISALDETEDKVRGFHAGAVDYITKPFNTGEVLARVETHLALRNLQTKIQEQNLQLLDEIEVRKVAEGRSRLALRDKEMLLREIHHRVKNNMQTISALLTLQARDENDDKIDRIVSESKARIQTMAMIHEMLSMSESFAEIELGSYLENLVEKIKTALGVDPGKIGVRIDVEETILSSDQAVPCALSVTEILSNSIEHAFPGDLSGEIVIEVQLSGDDEVLITISDDGVGVPEGADQAGKRQSLGLSLVESLVTDQLHGKFERETVSTGSRFTIGFKRVTNPKAL
jgi:two-component sensor histidine kinase